VNISGVVRGGIEPPTFRFFRSREHRLHAVKLVVCRAQYPEAALRRPPTQLPGYQMLEITLQHGSPAAGTALRRVAWPPGATPAAILRARKIRDPDPDLTLAPGDRIILLAATPSRPEASRPGRAPGNAGWLATGDGTRTTTARQEAPRSDHSRSGP
jgi:hypothetical protein